MISNIDDDNSVIAFCYIWPQYGCSFLEKSIQSVLPYVKKYVLIINKYSYKNNKCSDESMNYINNIILKFNDKLEVHYNDNINSKNIGQNDVNYYINLFINLLIGQSKYLLYLSADEIYDDINMQNIISLLHDKSDNKCVITQPICYFDNPHWQIFPVEDINRPSIIPNELDIDLNNKVFVQEISFHHMSYVMPYDEILFKFSNWGHCVDVNGQRSINFFDKFDKLKTNKSIKNLHPIFPFVFESVIFVNTEFHKELFYDWIYYLLNYNFENYSINSTNYLDRFKILVMFEFVPINGNILSVNNVFSNNCLNTPLINFRNTTFLTYNTLIFKLEDSFFDCIYIDINTDDVILEETIINCLPKLKNYGILFGIYESSNSLISTIIANLNKKYCDSYEFYHNLFFDIENYKSFNFGIDLSVWFMRLKR